MGGEEGGEQYSSKSVLAVEEDVLHAIGDQVDGEGGLGSHHQLRLGELVLHDVSGRPDQKESKLAAEASLESSSFE